ncbi:hypothetical protein J3Q64DRAFT_1722250 [Phycomyces blakesleeanus]|uniref:Uncharacterized protein n=1 Tax=Phycomyces blakesleeanus TaxID=4837 RepID=A0ABR3BAG7_PHYBL
MDPRMAQYPSDYGQQPQQQLYQQGLMVYGEDEEDGPIIPQLGDRFATQNSLLDMYRPDHPTAREQEGYARATGQPLIQLPNKQSEPRAGLVGMITQIEHGKKERDANKSRYMDMEKDRLLERERERYIIEQRQMAMQNPQMMMGMQGMQLPMMPMMDPRMSMMSGMQGMQGMQLPMMPMMDPRMSMMPGMQLPMMPMLDPRMSMMPGMTPQQQHMMMMQNQASMYGSPATSLYNYPRYPYAAEDEDDEDDDVPLGSKPVDSRSKDKQ